MLQRQLSNGKWIDDSRTEEFISDAADHNATTTDDIIARLEAGKRVRYYSDWYANIRYKPAPRAPRPEPQMVKADCGHWVEEGQGMSASLGTSCARCYDRMSDGF